MNRHDPTHDIAEAARRSFSALLAQRAGAVLFIASSKYDEAEEVEDRSARLTNPPTMIADVPKRYEGA